MHPVRARSSFLAFVALALGGCAAVFGFDELTDRGSADAGSNLTPGVIADFYVSPLGNDAADGTVQHPLRSVRAAVDRAIRGTAPGVRQRVAVCEGDYPEQPIVVRGGIDLAGSYDCQSWARKSFDDAVVGTTYPMTARLTDSTASYTLISLEDDASGAPRFDGFKVSVVQSAVAISILGSGAASQLDVMNGSPPLTAYARAVIGITTGAGDSVVEHCDVSLRHASPTAESSNASGLLSSTGRSAVRRNRITLEGVFGYSAGYVAGNGAIGDLVENQLVLVGSRNSDREQGPAVGIYAKGAALRSVRNVVQFETPGSTVTDTQVVGIAADAPGRLSSDGDRIFGPSVLATDAGTRTLVFLGVQDNGGLERLVNASIVLSPLPGNSTVLARSAGVRVIVPSTALIAHNTMYLNGVGVVDGTEPPARGLVLGDTALLAGPSALVVEANLMIVGAPAFGVVRAACTATQFSSLARNVYGGSADPVSGPDCDVTATLDDLWPGAVAANRQLTCGSSCASLLQANIESMGLRLTPAGCAEPGLRVASMAAVTTDADGLARDSVQTYAGAFANCP